LRQIINLLELSSNTSGGFVLYCVNNNEYNLPYSQQSNRQFSASQLITISK